MSDGAGRLRATIERCLELTMAALDASHAGDWEEVSRLDAARLASFPEFGLDHLDPDAAAPLIAAMRELLDGNARLIAAATAERHRRLAELRRVRRNLDGARRYDSQDRQTPGIGGYRRMSLPSS